MAKCDIVYKLANRSLGGFLSPLRYLQIDNDIDFLKEFFESKKNTELNLSEQLTKFNNSVKTLAFTKSIKGLSLDEIKDKYPNLIGEIFAYYNLKGKRQDFGQFFTPQQVTNQILDRFDIPLDKIDRVIDPCCGVGGLLLVDRFKDKEIVYSDIPYVESFFRLNAFYNGFDNIDRACYEMPDNGSPSNIGTLMMLNPPFIKDSAIDFCIKAKYFAEYLILIVPSNFHDSPKYKNASAIIKDNFDLLDSMPMPSDTFDWYETKVNTCAYYYKSK